MASSPNSPAQFALRPWHTLTGHRWAILKAAWSLDGRMLLTADELTIRLWDVEAGKLLQAFSTFHQSISWSPDGTNFAAGGFTQEVRIRLCDPPDCTEIQTLEGHNGAINDVAWSPDGNLIATASNDGTVHLWDAKSAGLLTTFPEQAFPVFKLAWSPNSLLLASLATSGRERVHIWDGAARVLLTRLDQTSGAKTMAWSPAGNLFATAGQESVIHLWNTSPWSYLG